MRRHLLPSHNWTIFAFLFVKAWRDSRCKSWKKLFSLLAELGLFWGDESSGVESPSCSRVGLVLGEKNSCGVELLGVFWLFLGEVSIELVLRVGVLSSSKYWSIFSLTTHERCSDENQRKQLVKLLNKSTITSASHKTTKSLVIIQSFFTLFIHSSTWTPFPVFVEVISCTDFQF